MSDTEEERLQSILRHIKRVQDNCEMIAKGLVEDDEITLARVLVANAQMHDNSKFHGIEWEYLNGDTKENDPEKFAMALTQHVRTNLHHPEAWPGGIKEMPRIYVAEFVADVLARSQEFGTDIQGWLTGSAMKKFSFNASCKVYKDIKYFLGFVIEPAFK